MINICLGFSSTASIEDNIIIKTDDKFELCFFSKDYRLEQLLVSVKCETEKFPKKYIINGHQNLDITKHIKAGQLFITISMLKSGEPLKTWTCPPILIKELSDHMELFDGYIDLIKRVELLEEKTRVIM